MANWLQESDLCPHPPSSRNCLHHIREDRALEKEREWGGGRGRCQPGPWALEPSDSLTARANTPRPWLQSKLPGSGVLLPGPWALTSGAQHQPAEAGAPTNPGEEAYQSYLLSSGEWLLGQVSPAPRDAGPGVHTWGPLQDKWDPGMVPLGVSPAQQDAGSEGTQMLFLSPHFRGTAAPGVFMSCHKPVPLDSALPLSQKPRLQSPTPVPRGPHLIQDLKGAQTSQMRVSASKSALPAHSVPWAAVSHPHR